MSNSFLCVLMSAHKSPKGMQIMRIVIKLQEHLNAALMVQGSSIRLGPAVHAL